MLKKIDQYIHKHFSISLLSVKMVLIPVTVIYFIFVIIIDILEKKEENESIQKWKKGISIFNNILFYVIIVVVIVLSLVLMYITRSSSLYVLQESYETITNKKVKKNTNITIPQNYLVYYVSVIWWMLFYLIVVTIFVTIAKVKHDPTLIYNLF